MDYTYKVKATAELEEIFFFNDERLIDYFGQEKFETTPKEVLLKQLLEETQSVIDWNQTDLKIEIIPINE